jgi:acyl-coenzyme A thioesterase PaaI-like protein
VAPPIDRGRDGADRAICDVTLSTRYEGNVGWVHGGWVAAIWDEVLAVAKAPTVAPSVTGTLTIRYRRPTPLGTPLRFVAEVDRVEGRKIFAVGRCTTPDGTIASEADAIFITVDPTMIPAFTEGLTEEA